jgi:cation diffusion facilitator CzcD-associated flavoprotein CzcO
MAGGVDLDVLIVGGGLSGVGAACHLRMKCPGNSFLVLEGRDAIGGTWDLFRYPGIRSDSDMHTLGYAFRPWTGRKSITDGESIRDYIRDTAEAYGVTDRIRLRHRVNRASWSSADSCWTVDVDAAGEAKVLRARFLYMCSGYYDYERGYLPEFPGIDRFGGTVIHPQHWPEDLDYRAKRIVVIGSGATAVTLVPELAKTAAHVVMLQRSPSYVVSRPSEDAIARRLRRVLPAGLAQRLTRWKNVGLGLFFYTLARRRPEKTREAILKGVREALGPGYDVGTHFTPRYNPWDQRLCLVPDNDLFEAIKAGTASVVTGEIEGFEETGIRLRSGETIAADIVVTATGLNMKLMGGVALDVDGTPVSIARTLGYKGTMFSDVPNLFYAFGYTNASWTLKIDLTADYVCRLINFMDQRGYAVCTPRRDPEAGEEAMVDFSSGYIQRSLDQLPKQGRKAPWKLRQNYFLDMADLRLRPIEDGVLEFVRSGGGREAA